MPFSSGEEKVMSNSNNYQLQQRLNRVEASLDRLIDNLPGLTYRCSVAKNHEYTMVFASKGCKDLLGISQEVVMRSPINTVERMTQENDLSTMRSTLKKAISHQQNYELYYRITPEPGTEKWIWDQGAGIYDEQGKCLFLEGIMMDVTVQKNSEQILKKKINNNTPCPTTKTVLDKSLAKARQCKMSMI